jgi:hypothetical protein
VFSGWDVEMFSGDQRNGSAQPGAGVGTGRDDARGCMRIPRRLDVGDPPVVEIDLAQIGFRMPLLPKAVKNECKQNDGSNCAKSIVTGEGGVNWAKGYDETEVGVTVARWTNT